MVAVTKRDELVGTGLPLTSPNPTLRAERLTSSADARSILELPKSNNLDS